MLNGLLNPVMVVVTLFVCSVAYGNAFTGHDLVLAVVAFFAAPVMSRGRLLLATVLSAYVVVGLRFEERDLARGLGGSYLAYRRAVPAFLPWPRRRDAAG